MKFSLDQINHVITLEQHRHFGRAAEHLGITQPALSRSILALEARLDGRLFERSRAGVTPTALGLCFLRHGREVLESAAHLQERLEDADGRAGQELNLACGLYPSELSLAPALGRLLKEAPETVIRTRVTDWNRCQALLNERAVHLALAELDQVKASAVKVLNRMSVPLLVRAGHALAQRSAPSRDDVLSYPWAAPVMPPRAVDLFTGPCRAGNWDDATGRFVPAVATPSLSVMLRCVLSTDVVGMFPLVLAEKYLERGEVELVRYRSPWLRLNYGLAWHADRPMPARARRFMALVEAEERSLQERERALARRYGCADWLEVA